MKKEEEIKNCLIAREQYRKFNKQIRSSSENTHEITSKPFVTKRDLIEMTFSHRIFPNNFLNIFRELTTKFKAENLFSIQFQVQALV